MPLTFEERLTNIIKFKGKSKGYDGGKGQLWLLCKDLPHPLGEIIYKVVRYHNQRNPEDLIKIAGWAKLMWETNHVGEDRGANRPRNTGSKRKAWPLAITRPPKVHGVATGRNRGGPKRSK